jgi:hypothetical protein
VFQAHVELLRFFLSRRDDIVDAIQEVLNARRRPVEYLRDRPLLSRHFEDCLFTRAGITSSQSRLRGQLEDIHWAGGFRPREIPGLQNGLVDPAEMMVRAFHLWQQTHWPGRSGRVRYAHTLFNVGLAMFFSVLTVYFRDTSSFLPYFLRIWLYISPVIYRFEDLPGTIPASRYTTKFEIPLGRKNVNTT